MKAPHTNCSNDADTGVRFETVDLFGLPFIDAGSEEELADELVRELTHSLANPDRLPLLVTPNVDIIVQLAKGGPLATPELANAAYVLPDGWPIVATSRLAGTPLRARLAGSTLFSLWWPRIAADRRRVACLVSRDDVKQGLLLEHPEAVVDVPPMIDTSPDAIAEVAGKLVADAVAVEAEFVVIGIGHPKDALLGLELLEQWPDDLRRPLVLCLGASAEFHVGVRRRAPELAQRLGLEWLVRFVQEPRRMFHRYFVRDVAFLPLAWAEIRSRGRR